MKKIQNRKIVSLLMVLALVISMLPMTAFAETTTIYTEEELLQAVNDGGEYKLGADIETDGVDVDSTTSIDLYGYSIIASESCVDVFYVNETTLTITDSSEEGTGCIDASKAEDSAIWNCVGGTVVINGGNIKMGEYGIYVDAGELNITGGIVECVESGGEAVVNVTNGTVEAWVIDGGTFNFDPTEYVDTDIYQVEDNLDGTFTVSEIGNDAGGEEEDGTIVAWEDTNDNGTIDEDETTYTSVDEFMDLDVAVKLATSFETYGHGVYGTVVIDLNGHTITANEQCVDVFYIGDEGSLTIKDSSTEGTGMIDATNAADSAIWYGGGETVTIEGGTIKSGQNYGIYFPHGTLNISGGYISEVYLQEDWEACVWNITGGTFGFDPSEYLSEEYIAKDNGDETYTVIKAGKYVFRGAKLALGESLTMKYYVKKNTNEALADGTFLAMHFETDNEKTGVQGVYDATSDMYVFDFEYITPQCMGDEIDASLVIMNNDLEQVGEVLLTKNDYSVAEYLQTLLDSDADSLGISEEEYSAMEQLIADLIYYGTSAQNYRDYKTDALLHNLVNCICGASAFEEIIDGKKELSTSTNSEVYFTAAGVWFDYVNQLYFKFTAPEDANVTVWIDGEEAYVENIEGTTTYIVYSDAILATEFDKTYEVELQVDGTTVQTLKYGVVSYVYAKQWDWNDVEGVHSEIAMLAQALYLYGMSAIAYAEVQNGN